MNPLRLLSLLLLLPGCAATPRTACQPMSLRLLQHRDCTTCMTGPWPSEWRWLSAGRFVGDTEQLHPLSALVLPTACEVFDTDKDGDVDLRDWSEVQNADD